MTQKEKFLTGLAKEHTDITRRYFLRLGAIGATALSIPQLWAQEGEGEASRLLSEAISKLEYLTR